MTKINSENLLQFLSDYFISIGCDSDEVKDFFSARRFPEGIVLNMPASNLLSDNRPKGFKGKQSHIHVTSKSCEFFYSADELSSITASTDWKPQNLKVSLANIASLSGAEVSRSLSLVNTFMMMKVECRKTQEKQVQLSKITKDDHHFIDLRKGIRENDVLIFLKYRDSSRLFVVAIPHAYLADRYEFDTPRKHFKAETYSALESSKAVPVSKALENVLSEHSADEVIESDDSISDAIYQSMVDDAEPSETDYIPEEYISTSDSGTFTNHRPKTNPSIGKEAIRINGYTCAIDSSHTTFVKPDGTRYMEVHHLIPLSRQIRFKNKLDTKANIIPLCPTCHRMLHHGRFIDIEPVLEDLFRAREDKLARSGLHITLDELKDCYR